MSKKKKMSPSQKASARWEVVEEPLDPEMVLEQQEEERQLHRKGVRNLFLLILALLFFIVVFYIILSNSL